MSARLSRGPGERQCQFGDERRSSRVIHVPLSRGYSAIVDPEDEDVLRWKWRLSSRGYAVRNPWNPEEKRQVIVFLHRYIVGAKRGEVCDHINRDPLDCRRSNLRIVSFRVSTLNRRPMGRSSSYRGVNFNRGQKKFQALIQWRSEGIDRSLYLGSYDNEIEAAMAYDRAAREVFGADAYPNFPLPGENGYQERENGGCACL